jgi:hypothetical protein
MRSFLLQAVTRLSVNDSALIANSPRRIRQSNEIAVLRALQGHQDPETMGILGAAWDGLYQESGKMLHLRRSRELYRTAFQGDSKDYYTGINAAAKSLFLGESQEADNTFAGGQPDSCTRLEQRWHGIRASWRHSSRSNSTPRPLPGMER